MKHPFLKSVLALGAALALVSCSEDAANAVSNLDPYAAVPDSANSAETNESEPCWLMEAIGQKYLVYPAGIVTDINGQTIAQVTLTQDETEAFVGTAITIDGTPLFEINTADLPVVTREQVTATVSASSAATLPPVSSATVLVLSSASVTALSSNSVTIPVTQSSSAMVIAASSSSQQQQVQSSATTASGNCDGKCYDSISGKCVDYYAEQTGSKGEKYAYDNTCSIKCYYDPDNKDCKNISGSAPASSAQAKSSSSVKSSSSSAKSSSSSSVKSSSSSAKSSSSSQQQISTNFNVKSGGRSGQGWGSRYWDCCKPHCAWSGKGGPIARTCNAQQQVLEKGDDMVKSICDGGPAGLCNSQAPFAINDNLAYAFAAGPGTSYAGSCGSCFLLTFNGESRHTTDARTAALKGKQMVIMISNIGYDVEDGQFDMMIPGGGVGAFNGCSTLWGINNLGAQHGGFLKDCGGDKKVTDVATVQKCLEDKCNSVFANIPDAKAGCLFHAQWLMAANNPSFTYQELESCPQELVNKY